MTIEQSSVTLTARTNADTVPGDSLAFPIPPPGDSSMLAAGQTVYLTVYTRDFPDLAVDLSAPDAVSVIWPADAPYPLPPGEYNCEFRTTAPEELPPDAGQAASVADVVLVAQEVAADADLATLTAAYNGAVAAHDELATQFNTLLANLRAAGLMAKP